MVSLLPSMAATVPLPNFIWNTRSPTENCDGVSLDDKGREIFETILRVASGERSKSEQLGYGGAEFVPWQIGATM